MAPPLVLALVALALPLAYAKVPPSAPSYTALAPFNRQFAISMQKKNTRLGGDWVPHTCNATALGGPCNQPPFQQDSGWQIRINFNPTNASAPFRTWKNGVPVELIVRLDYAPSVALDRGWRKKNGAWPGYGKHAKWEVAKMPFNRSGSAIWNLDEVDEVTDAILYPEVCVKCKFPDGKVDFCQCDRRNNATSNFLSIETEVMHDDVTPGMRAAAIILSIFSPCWLAAYALGDWLYYRRTGKPLSLAH